MRWYGPQQMGMQTLQWVATTATLVAIHLHSTNSDHLGCDIQLQDPSKNQDTLQHKVSRSKNLQQIK